jgi:hypothetical protein
MEEWVWSCDTYMFDYDKQRESFKILVSIKSKKTNKGIHPLPTKIIFPNAKASRLTATLVTANPQSPMHRPS